MANTVTVLKKFFGLPDGGLAQFRAELADLTPEEKIILANLAAPLVGIEHNPK